MSTAILVRPEMETMHKKVEHKLKIKEKDGERWIKYTT
jgi:hypothetical protein